MVGIEQEGPPQPIGPAVVKPGIKTSEFWLHLLSVVLGGLATVAGVLLSVKHGEVSAAAAIATIAGVVTSSLSACGYSSARAAVKNSQVLLLAIALALMSGCATEKKELQDLVLEGRDLLLDPACMTVQDPEWQARRFVFLSDSAPVDTRTGGK